MNKKHATKPANETKQLFSFGTTSGYKLNSAVAGKQHDYEFVSQWFKRQRIDAYKYDKLLME